MGPDVYYCDTDSIFTSKPLPENIISSGRLGDWKLEGMVEQGVFIAPKFYWCKYADGHQQLKIKGINSQGLFHDKEKWSEWIEEVIKNQGKVTIPGNLVFQRSVGKIYVRTVEKVLEARNLKRRWMDNGESDLI